MGVINWYLRWCDRWMPGYTYDPDPDEYGDCARCEERIRTDVKECPECGNRPSRKSWRSALIAFGVGVILTVIIPPIGALLMLIAGVWALGSKKLKPVDYEF